MNRYRLIYFNSMGRAELCRLIFAQAEVEYEDVRLTSEEWAELKPSTPTGQLPLLEVDGRTLSGSGPIARFLAERLGLAGSNDFDNGKIAGIADYMDDFKEKLVAMYFDEKRRVELLKVLLEEDIPEYWGTIESMIQKNNAVGGWVFNDGPTYADFSIYTAVEYVAKMDAEFFDKFPGVLKLKKAVEALPNIAKWLKERPKTDH